MRTSYRFTPDDLIDNGSFIIKTCGAVYFVRSVSEWRDTDEYLVTVTNQLMHDYASIWTPARSGFLDDVVGIINSEIDDPFREASDKCSIVIEPVRVARINTLVPTIPGETTDGFRVLLSFEDGRSEWMGTFNDEDVANRFMKYAQDMVQSKGHHIPSIKCTMNELEYLFRT